MSVPIQITSDRHVNMLSALFVSFFFVLLLWWIFGSIGRITNSIQYQEVTDWSVFMLYLPSIIVNLVWIYCVFKYFKPIKHHKLTKSFAKPIGHSFDPPKLKTKRNRIRQFLIIGTILGLITIYFKDIESYGHGDSWTNLDRNSLRTTITPILTTLGKNVKDCISNKQNTNSQQIQTQKNSSWENIFTNDLNCFEKEHIAYENALIQMNTYNSVNFRGEDDKFKMMVYYEPFEYWIDPEESGHFKLRFNTLNCYEIDKFNEVLLYDANFKKFTINTTQHRGKTGKLMRHTYFSSHILNFWTALSMLEYDSKTKECKFVYDNDWDNFKENHKWVIYLTAYLVLIITCYVLGCVP